MKRGKLITIYGINNLGKSTQAELLVKRIIAESLNRGRGNGRYLKYPLYNLKPTGPAINAYLREKNPDGLSAREFQMLNIMNRTQYDSNLRALLQGIETDEENTFSHVVAEDYWGTGVAWGIGAGVDKNFLLRMNAHLLKEDIAFLFDGQRFSDGIEKGHAHESNDNLTERVRLIHLELAREFGWHIVNANLPKEVIHAEIWSKVKTLLGFLVDDFKDSTRR